ncbi:MAG: hypothetical protein HYS12_05440 [Planctomycetes bacterium]|nr:hypothetical protein [Planctomycetota bacterium]
MFSARLRRRMKSCPPRPILRSRPSVEALEDRVLLSHTPLAPEFVVNTNPVAGAFAPPAVATASDVTGDFVVAWTNAIASKGTVFYQVLAQRFNRDGVAQGGEIAVSAPSLFAAGTGNGAVTVDVSMDATGDFVVVYDASNGNGSDQVFAHLYAADGTDRGQIVVSPTNDPTFSFSVLPSVASDSAGDFVVAFTTNNASGKDVFARQFNASGAPLGAPIHVSTDQTTPLTGPSVGSDGAGNFVVAWNGQGLKGNIAIVGRRFSSGGAALDAAPFVVSQTDQINSTPDVKVARVTGSFVITWDFNSFVVKPGTIMVQPALSSTDSAVLQSATEGVSQINFQPGNNAAFVLARRYDAAGTAQEPAEFVVNSEPLFTTAPPHVAVDADGDFAIVWATGQGLTSVFLRTYTPDGTAEGPQGQVNSFTGDLRPNDVASDDCGNLVVGWTGFITNSANTRILARVYRSSEDCNPMQPTPDTPETPTPTPTPPPPVVVPPPQPSNPDPALVIALARATAVPPPVARAFEPFLFLGFTPPPPATVPVPESQTSTLAPFLQAGGVQFERLGEISGHVFEDLNGNGIQDPGEPNLRGQTVFLDLNDNGLPDEGEPKMETDAEGRYIFSGLALTRYKVRQDLRVFRLRQTAPQDNRPYVVDLTPQNSSIADKDFGVRVLPVTRGTTKPKVPPPVTPSSGEEPQSPPPKKAPDAPAPKE